MRDEPTNPPRNGEGDRPRSGWWRGCPGFGANPSTSLRLMSRCGSPREPQPCPGGMATCSSLPVPGRI